MVLGGCSVLTGGEPKNHVVSVKDYTGEDYGQNGYDKEEEIGLANRGEVEDAAKLYMKEFYNTDVEVQRIFGSPGAVTVIVRSLEDVLFNTFVIVPVDVESGQVEGEKTFSETNQVEIAIVSGLYFVAYKEEFEQYEQRMKQFAQDHQLDVIPEETLETIDFSGYSTPYLTIFPGYRDFEPVVESYLENNTRVDGEWRTLFQSLSFEPERILVKTEFYLPEGEVPTEELYKELLSELEGMDVLPRGEYTPSLYDHTIEPVSGTNNAQNSIVLSKEKVLKE